MKKINLLLLTCVLALGFGGLSATTLIPEGHVPRAITDEERLRLQAAERDLGDIELFDYIEREQLFDVLLPPKPGLHGTREDPSLVIDRQLGRIRRMSEESKKIETSKLESHYRDLLIESQILAIRQRSRLETTMHYRTVIRRLGEPNKAVEPTSVAVTDNAAQALR